MQRRTKVIIIKEKVEVELTED